MKFGTSYAQVARHLPASLKFTDFSKVFRVQSAGILLTILLAKLKRNKTFLVIAGYC
jgi:hypothetical protein